ncbi:hypothetical protein KBB96_16165 [Luteolibacter ambystomatis]|uniref:Uncharacterized protein n=1 Tax=Luteolibacter ambystomatis TaxID=2824561 RepID=A0A975G7V6_9BACT|nr:hypothetical protein [Luteolibacter ambystomatis]QUE50391.1 hypothetical protein KBB96_16165 [Luteolibacter ambystomatis]
MKRALMILLLAAGFSSAEQQLSMENLPLEEMVKSHVPENWKVVADGTRIIASTENVKFLFTISGSASGPDEDPWKDAVTKDFFIEIRKAPLISSQEFQKLRQARRDLLAERVRQWEKSKGEVLPKTLFGLKAEVDSIVPLPFCYDEHYSYYFYSSDRGRSATRPALALTCAKAIRESLQFLRTTYLPMEQAKADLLYPDPIGDIEDPPAQR